MSGAMRLGLLTIAVVLIAKASSFAMTPTLEGGGLAATPKGWIQFCEDNPKDCINEAPSASQIHLNQKALSILEKVNNDVNKSVKQVSDLVNYGVIEFWGYPKNGKGDCEDFVVEKRKRLIELGYPRSALLITIVRDLKNEGHAILTVRTDKGDIILDNQEYRLKMWFQTDYQFIKRQSEDNQNLWLALGAGSHHNLATSSR
jgi:predicted transglutaminase-like cysteine proteinase